jgi:hypothetical protein
MVLAVLLFALALGKSFTVGVLLCRVHLMQQQCITTCYTCHAVQAAVQNNLLHCAAQGSVLHGVAICVV